MKPYCIRCKAEKPPADLRVIFRKTLKSGVKDYHYCKECVAQKRRKLRQSASGKAHLRDYQRKFNQHNRHMVRAWNAAHYALKTGKLERPNSCTVCEAKVRLEMHHADYSKPLDVTFLCRACHERQHRMLLFKA